MRIQINLSEEMIREVDAYAKKMGVSRSAFCSMMVGQGVMNLNTAYKVIDTLGDKLTDEVIKTLPEELK